MALLDLKSATDRMRIAYEEISQAPTLSPDLVKKLADDKEYLSTVRRDIQQNVRRPISDTEVSAIQGLLELVIGVLSQEVVSSALKGPVSASSLRDDGYDLLDQLNEYSIVAEHFFDRDTKIARRNLTTSQVAMDVDAISKMSKDAKREVLDYIGKVIVSFADITG